MINDIMDLHTHTIASGHAYNTLYEMVRAAADHGVKIFGSTDHAPGLPGTCSEIYFKNFKVIPKHLFGIRLLMGCEVDITDYHGCVDLSESTLKRLDYAIASIHPQCYTCGTVSQNTSAYLGALKNPYIKIIGHPDDGRFPYDHDTLAAAAKEHHVLLELNNSSLHPTDGRPNAIQNCTSLLERCMHYHTPIIIDSDAHIAEDAGNHKRAHHLLEELHFPEELIVNTSEEKLIPYIPALLEQDEE